jgi:hypothetical protein
MITKLTDIERMIIASDHLSDDQLAKAVEAAVQEYTWYIRTRKWEIHFAIFKHRAMPEEQGQMDLANMMLDVVKVRHELLKDVRSVVRLYLSQEIVSNNTMTKMKKLQGDQQDAGRDEIEMNNKILSTKYLKQVPKAYSGPLKVH